MLPIARHASLLGMERKQDLNIRILLERLRALNPYNDRQGLSMLRSGMACAYARSITASMPFETSVRGGNSATVAWG